MQNPVENTGALSTGALIARVLGTAIRQPLVLIAAAALIIGAGLYLNWPAIVGLGIAPLILTFAPCALMCAVGLCARPGKGKADGETPSRDGQQ